MMYHGHRLATGIVELRIAAKLRRSILVGFQEIQSAKRAKSVDGWRIEIAHEPGVLVVIAVRADDGTGVSVMHPVTAIIELKSMADENRELKGERSVSDWLLDVCKWIERRESVNTQREASASPLGSNV